MPAQSSDLRRRLDTVRQTPGFVALWDFVQKQGELFSAWTPPGSRLDYRLEPLNYVRAYWGEGREATMADFPLLGRGPFGQAIRIRKEDAADFRPTLLVPRQRLHDTPLDVKGAGRSVSMVVWMQRESGYHALAGIWHEGTDLHERSGAAIQRVEPGMRQYALFAGLAANPGASAAHLSENGAKSFTDRYARNLSTTPDRMAENSEAQDAWDAVAFVFDNQRNTVTSYLNGVAGDFWVSEGLDRHPFFQWPAKAWAAAEKQDPNFPRDQYYHPPETKRKKKTVLERNAQGRTELHEFEFTKVRIRYDAAGKVLSRELAALRANPFWFPHDLYSPPSLERGGPFTIGRVIHSSRSMGTTGWIGGVAVFSRPLSARQMKKLAALGRSSLPAPAP